MKYLIFTLVLLASASAYCELAQEPADSRNAENAKLACDKLGALCENAKKECSADVSPMVNTCLAIRYFELEVAKERCGNSQYQQCDKKNREYGLKWMHELNIPNLGNPKRQVAFKECESVGKYKVKSKELERFAVSVYSVFQHLRDPIKAMDSPYYQDGEQYYKCFEEKLK